MKVCFAEEMRNLDRIASEQYGIPSIVLMENAANSCVKSLDKFNKIVIVCGKGNNAGDGFCIARHLYNKEKDVKIYLVFGEDFSGDAKINYDIISAMGIRIESCDSPQFDSDLMEAECIVDAIFGTGIRGEIKSPALEIIEKINSSSGYVLSVDVPSGIDADNGSVTKVAVRADKTVTFAAYKAGLLLYPGAEFAGEIEVTDISIPKNELSKCCIETLEPDEIIKIMPRRFDNSHKGDYGKVFIIGGSRGMAGAVALAARAAFRVGAGLVTACVPNELNDVIQVSIPEATVFSADFENEQEKIIEKMQEFDVILFGNGIGRESYIEDLLFNVLENANTPIVIDADGLFALSKNPDMLRKCTTDIILTPHSMEFARLLGKTAGEVEENRLLLSCEFAEEFGVTLVLKGNHTIITTPDLTQHINMTGNSGMATGGSGDVLAGMIAGFAPRMDSISDSGKLSVYLHGCAGDYVKKAIGADSCMAGDIVEAIAHILPVEK